MNKDLYGPLSGAGVFLGILLFALARGSIIVYWPALWLNKAELAAHPATKRTVTLPFFKEGVWQKETQELLWQENMQENIRHLINALLNVWNDEQISCRNAHLQSSIIDPLGQTAYLSFDRVPFHKHAPTREKWLVIEGVLKALRDNAVPLQQVYIFVNHTPLKDPHLDFEQPWPLEGFL